MKKVVFTLAIALAATSTFAQEAPAPSAQPAPGQEFTLRLQSSDLQIIWDALSERPYRVSAPVLAKLQAQVSGQLAARPQGQVPPGPNGN